MTTLRALDHHADINPPSLVASYVRVALISLQYTREMLPGTWITICYTLTIPWGPGSVLSSPVRDTVQEKAAWQRTCTGECTCGCVPD